MRIRRRSSRRRRATSGDAERRRVGELLLGLRSLSEMKVVGAFLALDKEAGDVSWDELRSTIAEADAGRAGYSIVERGLKQALANGTLKRTRVAAQRYRYEVGPKVKRWLAGEPEAR